MCGIPRSARMVEQACMEDELRGELHGVEPASKLPRCGLKERLAESRVEDGGTQGVGGGNGAAAVEEVYVEPWRHSVYLH